MCTTLVIIIGVTSASLVGVSVDSLQHQTTATLVSIERDGQLSTLAKIEGGDGILPNLFAADDNGATVAGFTATGSVLRRLGYSGERTKTWTYGADFLPTNMLSDPTSGVAILDARNLTDRTHSVFEVDDSGRRTVKYTFGPKVIVDVGVSTYCAKGRIFFLTLRDDDTASGVDLVRVDLDGGRLLGRASFEEQPQAILWEQSAATLYAWIQRGPPNRTKWGACLVPVDPESGRSGEPVACFDGMVASLASTPMALDPVERVVFSALITETHQPKVPNVPHWVSVDLKSGRTTQTQPSAFVIGLSAWQRNASIAPHGQSR